MPADKEERAARLKNFAAHGLAAVAGIGLGIGLGFALLTWTLPTLMTIAASSAAGATYLHLTRPGSSFNKIAPKLRDKTKAFALTATQRTTGFTKTLGITFTKAAARLQLRKTPKTAPQPKKVDTPTA